jgi:hypothetical protein
MQSCNPCYKEYRTLTKRTAEGCEWKMEQLAVVVFHQPFAEERHVFLLKRRTSVMRFLIQHVITHLRQMPRADGEGPVTLLPVKARPLEFPLNPCGGIRLQLPHHIRKPVRGAESCQHVHVIIHAADGVQFRSPLPLLTSKHSEPIIQP